MSFVAREQITVRDWSMKLDDAAWFAADNGATRDATTVLTGYGQIVENFEDVGQCIRIIVTTPKGSDPLRLKFGCGIFDFLDKPLSILKPHAVREITDAIRTWEPRAVVERVDIAFPDVANGVVEITVRWRPNVSSTIGLSQQTTVQLTRG